jgi:serine/threonine protein phosphatase PrpC
VAYTHPGGSKPLDAKNQDTYFHLAIDDHNQVFGVLDGHGSENGTLVAEVASGAIKAYLAEHFNRLRTEPEAVFATAFERAHEAARQAVLESALPDENFKVVEGVVVDEWEGEDDQMHLDAVDGGTTATVIALVDGSTLVHAQVGDSSALLGGVARGGERASDGDGPRVIFSELMEEHSATNVLEYQRVLSSGPRSSMLRFTYDVPDALEDEGAHSLAIFRRSITGRGGGRRFELNDAAKEYAEELGAAPKNVAGELPTILLTATTDTMFPRLELPLTLAMTRSIGDFYLHTCGVTWRPQVVQIDLAHIVRRGLDGCGLPSNTATIDVERAGGGGEAAGGGDSADNPALSGSQPLDHLTLILASDGVWDLYEKHDVFRQIVCPPTAAGQPSAAAHDFFAASVELGAEIFGSSSDNMTGIVVYLNPPGTTMQERGEERRGTADGRGDGAQQTRAVSVEATPSAGASPPAPPAHEMMPAVHEEELLDDDDFGA